MSQITSIFRKPQVQNLQNSLALVKGPVMEIYGPKRVSAFQKLTGQMQSSQNGKVASAALVSQSGNCLAILNNRTLSVFADNEQNLNTIQKQLRVQSDNDADIRLAATDDVMRYNKDQLRLSDFPNQNQFIQYGLSCQLQLIKETIQKAKDLRECHTESTEVKGKVDALVKDIVSRFCSDIDFLSGHVNALYSISLSGTDTSGKSALLDLISPNNGESDMVRIRIAGYPVELSQVAKQDQTPNMKLMLLDMPQLYKSKNKLLIPQNIQDQIDQDTVLLLTKRDKVSIRTPLGPAKLRYKQAPLSPQGDDVKRTAFRGRIPLRLDGNTEGNDVKYGDYGLRVLEDVRLTEKCLQEVRATLHRHVKQVKGGRFWLRVLPTHPMSSKPLGVRMGKGKGALDHWEAKVCNKQIVCEIGGGVREDIALNALKIAGAKVPGKTEVVTAPSDETIEEFEQRIKSGLSGVGCMDAFAVSLTTGEGMDRFLEFLARKLQQAYPSEATNPAVEAQTHLSQTLSSIQQQVNHESDLSADALQSMIQQLDALINPVDVSEAIKFAYHSQYGVIKENQEISAAVKAYQGNQVTILNNVAAA
ncbi:hypothetical protein MP228_007824 [Amoeboaphelidium protococcarum]|nr:hypothetical protein MP228_007824 [Amoeboaphelidium protococcarum]